MLKRLGLESIRFIRGDCHDRLGFIDLKGFLTYVLNWGFVGLRWKVVMPAVLAHFPPPQLVKA